MTAIVVVGDALLDRDWTGVARRLSPDAPVPVLEEPTERVRPGGAGLAALAATRDGADVVLVTALARDAGATFLREALEAAGVAVVDLGAMGATPEKWRLMADSRTLLRLDRGCDPVGAVGEWTAAAADALAVADAVLVADYGRGVATQARAALADAAARVPIVWDPHRRGLPPVGGVALATPNRSEAAEALGLPVPADDRVTVGDLARRLQARWDVPVAVTAGSLGAALATGPGLVHLVPAVPAQGDTCGAGDRLAARVTVALARGGALPGAVADGVSAAAAFVRDGLTPAPVTLRAAVADAVALARRVRDAGGTVVAAGGCFDLLHAGHVGFLQHARELGSCLIVCLNSDRSVRRLKGPGRPVNPEHDREAVLRALHCVDAVALFDEDTPVELLHELRPHLFAKGADYDGVELPEAAALASWGGEIVLLPLVPDRSTTRIVARVRDDRALA